MKKIILTNYHADMGGGEFALLHHAEWLVRRGTAVTVCLFNEGPLIHRLAMVGAKVQIINVRLKCGPKIAWIKGVQVVPKLVRIFKEFNADVVIDYTHNELPFVLEAAKSCAIPVIYRDQGTEWPEERNVDWREKRLPLWLKNYLSGVVCTTRIKADDLIAKGAPTKKVHLVHLGIDPSDFVLGLSEIPSIRAELGFPPDCLIVGIFGRLIEWKGQSVFIRALSRLQRPDVYGLIVGGTQLNQTSGEQYASELRELAVQEGISDRIHFTGFREDVYRIMQACDIVCHASYREPFGLVIVEAMMAGKPVIASDVTGPREIIIEGATGFLVPPGDTTTMVERLTQLIEDRQLRDRLGFNGRKQALVRFDIEKNLAQLNSKIAEIILGQRNSSF